MARTENEDFLQNFRYHVAVFNQGGLTTDPIDLTRASTSGVEGEAGFNQVTIPELSVEATEYREGIYKWTRKLPGIPSFSDVTLMRGVTKKDTQFYDWGIQTASGGDYRVDLAIYQFARSDVAPGVTELLSATASRVYKCYDVFPIRSKPGADLDATSGEVSIAELDLAVERVEVEFNDTVQ